MVSCPSPWACGHEEGRTVIAGRFGKNIELVTTLQAIASATNPNSGL